MPIYLKSVRARRNMAWPKVIDGIEFEDLQEYLDYKEALEKRGLGGSGSGVRAGGRSGRAGRPERKKLRKGLHTAAEYQDKYARIVKSVGDWAVFDPALGRGYPDSKRAWAALRASAAEDGISQSQAILEVYGVTPGLRDAIYAEMEAAGVVCVGRGACHATTPAQKAQAAKILKKHVPGITGIKNPRHRRW